MKIQDPWEDFRREVRQIAERARGDMVSRPDDALLELSRAQLRIAELERELSRERALTAELAKGAPVYVEESDRGPALADAAGDIPWRAVKAATLAGLERAYFGRLTEATGGNVSEIARRAGTLRSHVRGYLRRHGIAATGGKSGPPVAVEPSTAPEAP